jgi:uncharacterized OsmC-like protein
MAIRQKVVATLKLSADCPSHSRSDLSIRDVEFSIDEPIARNGTNAGPSPTETALSALVGCTNVIGHKCANALGVAMGHLTISATCEFDRRGVTLAEEIDVPFQEITLTIQADGTASQEDIDRVAAEVAKFCPLSKLFRGAGTTLTEIWKAAP